MGYQDWQASERDTQRAVAAATAAKAAADSAIAAATAATKSAPINQTQAARQQVLVDAANAAIEKYNAAANRAAEFSKLSTDWFGLGQGFLEESGLNEKIYNPVTGLSGGNVAAIQRTVIGRTPVKDAKGNIIGYTVTYSDGSSNFEQVNAPAAAGTDTAQRERQSAYDLLYSQFQQYGLESLITPLKDLVITGVSPAEFTIKLRESEAYKKRFAANAQRVAKGLVALDEAAYIAKEDAYQNLMRNYGLPASYYTKDATGKQSGFDKFLEGDVSAAELEDRIATAQQRVLNSNPEVLQALKQFYPDISNADILAYTLDPTNALAGIKRKVTAAEIGGAALAQGLQAQGGTAESLAGLGVTKAQAQQGYANVAEILPRGSQLADIYGEQPYTQQTAEAEVFNTQGSAQAAARRRKLKSLEEASFGGSSGVGALGRDKAIYGGAQGQSGLY